VDRRSPTWWERHQRRIAPFLFLAPAAVLFVTFVVIPIVLSIALSFREWDGVGPARWIGLQNYVELAGDSAFWTSVSNNVLFVACFLVVPLAGLSLAIVLSRRIKGSGLYRTLFFFPFVLSQVVIGVIFGWFLNAEFGLVAGAAHAIGLPSPLILESPDRAILGVILAAAWPQIAYCMLLYLAGLSAIDQDAVEAARLDGASGRRLFLDVVLPQLRAATGLAFLVCVVSALRAFDLVAIMTNGGPFGSSMVLAFYMYVKTSASRYGYGAAIATVLFVMMNLAVVTVFAARRRRWAA
jgi:multiple sugar transport system permease protein